MQSKWRKCLLSVIFSQPLWGCKGWCWGAHQWFLLENVCSSCGWIWNLLHIQPSISIPARLVVWNKVHFFNWEFWEAWYLGPCLIPVSFCRIGIHLPDTDNTTSKWLKEDKLTDLKIYIHEQEKFIFHRSNNLNYFIVVLFSLMLS